LALLAGWQPGFTKRTSDQAWMVCGELPYLNLPYRKDLKCVIGYCSYSYTCIKNEMKRLHVCLRYYFLTEYGKFWTESVLISHPLWRTIVGKGIQIYSEPGSRGLFTEYPSESKEGLYASHDVVDSDRLGIANSGW
jgi:hypothetical protein